MQVLTNPIIEEILRYPGGHQAFGDPRVPFAMRTHQGSVRGENQDRVVVALGSVAGEPWLFGAVGDGIGGMPRGGEAAALGLAVVVSELFFARMAMAPLDALGYAFDAANQVVHRALAAKSGFVAAAFLVTPHAHAIVHAGDARAYAIRADKEVIQLSTDDVLPGRSDLIQYVGVGDGFVPHVKLIPKGCSTLLLATDGAYGAINDRQLSALCASAIHATPLALMGLVGRLVEISVWFGGVDNATALALTLSEAGVVSVDSVAPTSALHLWTPAGHAYVVHEGPEQWRQHAAPRSQDPREKQKEAREPAAPKRQARRSDKRNGSKPEGPAIEFLFPGEEPADLPEHPGASPPSDEKKPAESARGSVESDASPAARKGS